MNDIRITYTVHKIGNSKSTKRKVLNVHSRVMGHKDEPYYNTEEMLSCAIYKYETLSKDEKIIYNKTKTK
jgi:hypothetical protein